jgi:hypothetical protein
MIVGSWQYKISNDRAMSGYKIVSKYAEKYGANGTSISTHQGADFGKYAFGARFNNMADYGKAADKLNGDKVWDNHQEMLSSTIWDGFNLRRVLAENGWKE